LVTCVAPVASVQEVGPSSAVEGIAAAPTFDVVVSFHSLEGVRPVVADERVGARRAEEALDASQDVSPVSARQSARQVGDDWTLALPADAIPAPSPEKPIIEGVGIVDHEIVAGTALHQVVALIATQKVAAPAAMELVSTGAAADQVVPSPCANVIVPSPGDDDVPAGGTEQVVVSACPDDRRYVSEAGLRSGGGRSPVECERAEDRNCAMLHGRDGPLHALIFGTPPTEV
jgi:hypothetical protein